MQYAMQELSEVALGGTAVGTGVNAHPEFASRVCGLLSQMIGIEVKETHNHFQAQSAIDSVVMASGCLRAVAVSLHKIANDIRWMGSGPRAGLGEIALPEVQPGSSIMPGKVNPVIAESLIQVIAHVLGNDVTVTHAGLGGYFELNTMMPVGGYYLLQSISRLASATDNFAEQCVKGIKATEEGPQMVMQGLMLATALAPVVGYDKAAEIAKEAARTGKTIRQVAKARTNLTYAKLDKILDPAKMTEPSLGAGPAGG
jgi:fumarate hydratase class II